MRRPGLSVKVVAAKPSMIAVVALIEHPRVRATAIRLVSSRPRSRAGLPVQDLNILRRRILMTPAIAFAS
jgi:hypothetical protein